MSAFKPGDVVRYASERGNNWCREGMALMGPWGNGAAFVDTYWGRVDQDSHRLTDAEVATAELIFNIGDYDELDQYDRNSRDQWAKFAPADREGITSQNGLQHRWFVRKGAVEDIATQIQNAQDAVIERERELNSAQCRLDWAREDLAAVRAQAVPS